MTQIVFGVVMVLNFVWWARGETDTPVAEVVAWPCPRACGAETVTDALSANRFV